MLEELYSHQLITLTHIQPLYMAAPGRTSHYNFETCSIFEETDRSSYVKKKCKGIIFYHTILSYLVSISSIDDTDTLMHLRILSSRT